MQVRKRNIGKPFLMDELASFYFHTYILWEDTSEE